jgi:hypothetical protein
MIMTAFRNCLCLALIVPSPLMAQALWQDARTGMTEAEIRKAFPTAETPAEIGTLADGAACKLQISNFAVDSTPFDVCFFMKSGQLSQVTLKSSSPSMASFRTMTALLRARYGAELSSENAECLPKRSLTLCKMEWLLDSGVNVNIVYLDVGGRNPLININYQTRVKAESSKL